MLVPGEAANCGRNHKPLRISLLLISGLLLGQSKHSINVSYCRKAVVSIEKAKAEGECNHPPPP